jgi:hypothetical protein
MVRSYRVQTPTKLGNNSHAMDRKSHAMDRKSHAMDRKSHAMDRKSHATDHNSHATDHNWHAMDPRYHGTRGGGRAAGKATGLSCILQASGLESPVGLSISIAR